MKTILTRIAYKDRIVCSGRGNRGGLTYYKRIGKLYRSTVYGEELGCEKYHKTFRDTIERIIEYCEDINIYV